MAKKIPKSKTRVPYTSLVGRAPTTPIFDPETQARLDEAIAPISGHLRWKKWGMKAHSTALLFHGEPGTGKTTAALYLAKRVSNGIVKISMADIGGAEVGSTERNAREIFQEAKNKYDNCTIFIDECDGILLSRERLGPDAMWMLNVITGVMEEIEKYEGLVILATNFVKSLDPALRRRLTDIIEIPFPNPEIRYQLWQNKTPEDFPLKLNHEETEQISKLALTGAEIETCIEREARRAIRLCRNPRFDSLKAIASEICTTARNSSTKG